MAGPGETAGETSGGLPLTALVEQILARATSPEAARDQLARLVGATQAIGTELELASALRNVVQVACDLVDASYGAIGVISAEGLLEEFIHVGMDVDTVHGLGHPPTGQGILGAVITDAAAIRLPDLTRDPRSVGFPAGHPSMTSFLGVPVRIRGIVYGNLYLTGARSGQFDETDEQIILSLATMAGTAIANARLYEDARLGQRWISASEEINQGLLSGMIADTDVSFISSLVIELSEAVYAGVVMPGGSTFEFPAGPLVGDAELEANAAFGALPLAVSTTLRSDPSRLSLRTVELAASAEIEQFGPVMIVTWGEATSSPSGALLVARAPSGHPFSGGDRQMTERFARSVSIARELATARNDRERVALADERDRIARDLHDHVIQSLFAVGLGLQSVVGAAPGPVGARIAAQVDAIDVTIRQIRQTIFQLGSPSTASAYSQKQLLNQLVRTILEGEGIDSSLDFRGPVDTLIDSELGEEVSAVLREALSNVVRHAEASRVDISVAVSTTEVRVVVTDNGRGLGELARRSGLDNLATRAAVRGGSFTIAARAPSGTTLDWAVPVVAA